MLLLKDMFESTLQVTLQISFSRVMTALSSFYLAYLPQIIVCNQDEPDLHPLGRAVEERLAV